MRSAALAFAGVFLAGLLVAVVLGLTNKSDLVYAPGVAPTAPVAPVNAGQTLCQGPIHVPNGDRFDRVVFTVGTYFQAGPPLRVTVDDKAGRTLAEGKLAAGYPDIADAPTHTVRFDPVETDEPVRVCIENAGDRKMALYGQAGIASPRTSATLDGQPIAPDIALTLRREPRSLIALLPTMAERAALFRAGWVSPVVYLVLALLLLIGAPLLLARGIGRAGDEDRGLRASAGRSTSRHDASASP